MIGMGFTGPHVGATIIGGGAAAVSLTFGTACVLGDRAYVISDGALWHVTAFSAPALAANSLSMP